MIVHNDPHNTLYLLPLPPDGDLCSLFLSDESWSASLSSLSSQHWPEAAGHSDSRWLFLRPKGKFRFSTYVLLKFFFDLPSFCVNKGGLGPPIFGIAKSSAFPGFTDSFPIWPPSDFPNLPGLTCPCYPFSESLQPDPRQHHLPLRLWWFLSGSWSNLVSSHSQWHAGSGTMRGSCQIRDLHEHLNLRCIQVQSFRLPREKETIF